MVHQSRSLINFISREGKNTFRRAIARAKFFPVMNIAAHASINILVQVVTRLPTRYSQESLAIFLVSSHSIL